MPQLNVGALPLSYQDMFFGVLGGI